MLYFICCSRNNGVIKEGSILRWMMCALERLVLSRNEKGNKCRNRRKKRTGMYVCQQVLYALQYFFVVHLTFAHAHK